MPVAASARPAAAVPPPVGVRRWLPLAVLLSALFVVMLDFFIVNVALPSMQAELDAGSGVVQLWVAGYGATLGALLIVGAGLGDRFGRRRVFMVGFTVFTACSAACGVAPDATTLVAARVGQGVGAALLNPQVLAGIGVVYRGADRARAIMAYGLTAGVAAISGQLVGGALMALDPAGVGWRACFLVNLPVGVAALALAPRLLPESHGTDRRPLDPPSVGLVSVGLALLVVPLVQGRALGWPAWVWPCLGVSGVLLAAFAVRQARLVDRGARPLIDPGLWREPAFTAGVLATLALVLGLASTFFVLALELQGGLGLSPLDSGLVFTVLAVGYVAASLGAPMLARRLGRAALTVGAACFGTGAAALALGVGAADRGGSAWPLVPGLLVIGVGMGLLYAPLVTVTLATLPVERAGSAAGVVSTVQQVGGALGVALLGIVFFGVLDRPTGGAYAAAFRAGTWCLVGLAVAIAVLVRRLPTPARQVRAASPPPVAAPR